MLEEKTIQKEHLKEEKAFEGKGRERKSRWRETYRVMASMSAKHWSKSGASLKM